MSRAARVACMFASPQMVRGIGGSRPASPDTHELFSLLSNISRPFPFPPQQASAVLLPRPGCGRGGFFLPRSPGQTARECSTGSQVRRGCLGAAKPSALVPLGAGGSCRLGRTSTPAAPPRRRMTAPPYLEPDPCTHSIHAESSAVVHGSPSQADARFTLPKIRLSGGAPGARATEKTYVLRPSRGSAVGVPEMAYFDVVPQVPLSHSRVPWLVPFGRPARAAF